MTKKKVKPTEIEELRSMAKMLLSSLEIHVFGRRDANKRLIVERGSLIDRARKLLGVGR